MTHYELDMRKLQAINPGTTGDELVQYLAQTMEADVKENFSNQSPSSPGDPPGIDTGNLKNSVIAQSDGPHRWAVFVGAEYGLWLEFGTRNMAPRPFMLPAFERTIKRIPRDWLKVK